MKSADGRPLELLHSLRSLLLHITWKFGTFLAPRVSPILRILPSEVLLDPMVIIAVFGGLVVGGALFAVLKNSGSKSAEGKYTKLDIG